MSESKKTTTYNIDKNLLEAFEKNKGYFKKSALISFWIQSFIDKKKGYIPQGDTPPTTKTIQELPTQRSES